MTKKTKIIVLNSPNNPSGRHYGQEWMKGFADFALRHPHLFILCDEIYSELFYKGSPPLPFYSLSPSLLERTIVVDGISKCLAATGLRIGTTLCPKPLAQAISRLQGHTASGANSLIQRALSRMDFKEISLYLEPIKAHLRENADFLEEAFKKNNLAKLWSHPTAAFYGFVDFASSPLGKANQERFQGEDLSPFLCERLLSEHGVALVPGSAFGCPNGARLSLAGEKGALKKALERLFPFLKGEVLEGKV